MTVLAMPIAQGLSMTLGVVVSYVIAIFLGVRLIRQARRDRVQVQADQTPGDSQIRLIMNIGYILVTAGVLAVLVYITTDRLGPRWLHAASLPSAVVLIVSGYVLAAIAGWREGGVRRR